MKNKNIIKISIMFTLALSLFSTSLAIKANDKSLDDDVVVVEDVPEEVEYIETDENQTQLGNANLIIIADDEQLEVGKIAQYQLYLSLDGRHETYKNVSLNIELPSQINESTVLFNQDLDELKILDVLPTYDANKKVLSYYFGTLSGGFETSLNLKIQTVNGSALNNVKLNLNASITGDEMIEKQASESIVLVANQNASVSNKLKGIMVDGILQDRISLKYMDDAIFAVGVSINKYTTGSMAPKEGSKVIFQYTFEEGVTYVSDTSGVTPTSDGLTYTWEFDSSLNEDDEYFFNTNFDIVTTIDGDLSVFSIVSNLADVSITYLDDTTADYSVTATAMISPNFDYELVGQYDGSAYSSVFSGPADGLGNVGWINNDDVSVTDGALLGWNFYLTSLHATNPKYGMNAYNVFFHPDENINIRNMYSGNFYYRPSSAFADAGLQPIEEAVYYSLSIKYADSDEWVEGIESIVPETYYTAEELGIDLNRKVETMWFHFHNNKNHIFWNDVGYGDANDSSVFDLPAGLTTTNLRIWTTIDEGYTGSIESKAAIGYSGWNSLTNANRAEAQSKYVPEELRIPSWNPFMDMLESRLLPKTAQVVAPPTGINRYVKSNVFFTQSNDNLIQKGDNVVQVEVTNDSASTKSLTGPFETYVLADEGVIFKDLDTLSNVEAHIVTENFKGTNKTLLKIVFNTKQLSYGTKTSVKIPVEITDQASYNLGLEVIGYLDYDYEVSSVSNTNGTFTTKELELFDFNENNVEEHVYVTRNTYTHISAYEYYTTLKGSNDGVNYHQHVNVTDDSISHLKLEVNNTLKNPISTFKLIGVLPDLEDTYILNDEARNSKFSMRLKGPIELPKGYEDYFDVFYSESKEPLVNGVLDDNVADHLSKIDPINNVDDLEWFKESEVKDFSAIKSYKIVMKSYVAPIHDSQFDFKMNIIIKDHNLTGKEDISDRVAYTTYATAINEATVFETQALNLIYELPIKYTIKAENVTMKLSDVRAMHQDKLLESYVKTRALPVVFKDNVELLNVNVLMKILNVPKQFEVGQYPLEFTYVYDENLGSSVTVSTKLIVVADDTEPTETKPNTPETGVNKEVIVFYLLIATASIVLVLLSKRKRVRK